MSEKCGCGNCGCGKEEDLVVIEKIKTVDVNDAVLKIQKQLEVGCNCNPDCDCNK